MHIHTVIYFLTTVVLKGLIKSWNGGCGSEKQSFSADVNRPLKPVIHRSLAAMFKASRLIRFLLTPIPLLLLSSMKAQTFSFMAGYTTASSTFQMLLSTNPHDLWELGLVIE